MKTKDLLYKLTDLEAVLASYSFEELKVADAAQLKKSFEHFKYHLQEKIATDSPLTKKNHSARIKAPLAPASRETHGTPSNFGRAGLLLKDSLTNFNGILDFLKNEVTTRQQWDHLNGIQETSTALLGRLTTLLAPGPFKKDTYQTAEIEVNLGELVDNAKFLGENLIIGDNLKIVTYRSQSLPHSVIGDMTGVMHLLIGMLGQAIQFSESGEIYFKVTSIATTDKMVILEFQIDNCSCKLFKPNTNNPLGSTNGQYDSKGMMKLLIENLGGSIHIFKNDPTGTVFKFTITLGIGKNERRNR